MTILRITFRSLMEVETYPVAWINRPSVDSWEKNAPPCAGALGDDRNSAWCV
jgi:hypothetical protein